MANIKDELRTLLLAQTSITTLAPAQTIGGKSYSAIFVDTVKQGIKPPFIEIRRTSFKPWLLVDETADVGTSEIDVDCYAYTETDADALKAAVSAYLNDFSGAAGGATIHFVNALGSDDYENHEGDGNDVWRYRCSLHYSMFHE